MEKKQVFKEYYGKLVREGVLKAVGCGAAIGFAVVFVIAFVSWMIPFYPGLFIAFYVGVGVAAGTAVLFYYKKFYPTTEKIARRLDRMGLEERMITMAELSGDQSYIAMLQREDAQRKLAEISDKKMGIRFSAAGISLLSVAATLGIAMTVVAVLGAGGVIPSGSSLFKKIKEDPEQTIMYAAVNYKVDLQRGYIVGEMSQTVAIGASAEAVTAVAKDGWMFYGWSDGATAPLRADSDVTEDITVSAIFVEMIDSGEPADGDAPSDRPFGKGESGDGPGTIDPSAPQRPDDGSGDGDEGEEGEEGDNNGNNSGSGNSGDNITYEENNQVIDGETYYRDIYQAYYDQAMALISEGKEVPEELRKLIETYFGIIL